MASSGDDSQQPHTRDSLDQMARSYQQSRILLSAVDLDVFRVIGTDGRTSLQVAGALHINPRATDRLLDALVVLDMLEKSGGKFRNTPAAAQYLDSSSPDFLFLIRHLSSMWDRWGTLTQAVRAGRSVHLTEYDPKRTEAFIDAMHARAKDDAEDFARAAGRDGATRILDVGGGSGVYSMALVRGHPGTQATVLDLPRVTEITRRYAALEGLSGQIRTIDGDYLETDFRHGYDLILMSAILHINSVDQNRLLLRKAHEALDAGGRIVIMEFLLDDDRLHPPFAALFALNMLTGTECGDAYTETEIRRWMEGAGFDHIERKDPSGRASMLIGHKH